MTKPEILSFVKDETITSNAKTVVLLAEIATTLGQFYDLFKQEYDEIHPPAVTVLGPTLVE